MKISPRSPHNQSPELEVGAHDSEYEHTYLRPEQEDDDGYDPYSDRTPEPSPLFEQDPWE